MMLRLSLGIAVAAATVIAAVFTNGSAVTAAQVLMILVPMILTPLGVLIAGPGPLALGDLFRAGRRGGSAADGEAAAATLRTLDRALLLSALMGMIVRLLYMMKSLADPTAVWRSFAWSLTPVLAGLFLHAVLRLPLGSAIQARAAAEKAHPSAQRPWSPLAWLVGSCVTAAGVLCFEPGAFATWLFADTPSILIAVFLPVGILMASSRTMSFGKAFLSIRSSGATAEELARAQASFRFLGGAFRASAAVGASLGAILFLRDFTDRMRSGPSLALLFLSAFWSILFSLLFALPLESAAEGMRIRSEK